MNIEIGTINIEKSFIFNSEISAQAKVMYLQFYSYAIIPNFKVSKDHMMSISGFKGKTFEKYWKELKDADLIKINCERVGKKYNYWFTIKNTEIKSPSEPVEESKDNTNSLIIEENTNLTLTPIQKDMVKYLKPIFVKRAVNRFKSKKCSRKGFNLLTDLYIDEHHNAEGIVPEWIVKRLYKTETYIPKVVDFNKYFKK